MDKEYIWTKDQCYLKDSCPKFQKGDCDTSDHSYCVRLHKLNSLYELAQIPMRMRTPIKFEIKGEYERDNFQHEIEMYGKLKAFGANITQHVANGDNLYIHSVNCGNGKTEWAVRLIRTYIGSIWATSDLKCRALFVHVPKFLIALKENISKPNEYAQYIKDNIMDADLVVFDEVGTKGLTQYESEQILSIINSRIDEGKSNIYTSNLSSEELKKAVGDRLASRIINMSEDIEFKGVDKRKLNARGNVNNG